MERTPATPRLRRGSLTGKYPVANTGGAYVTAFGPMSIPDDLRTTLDGDRR